MNVVYHAHYLVWFELGRTELMRDLGCSYASLEEQEGIYFPVRELRVRYRASARYDEVLDVHTALTLVGGAKVRFEYRISRQNDGQLIATGFSVHAAVGGDGRPLRLPDGLRGRLLAGAPRE